jgi:hypothetical protein
MAGPFVVSSAIAIAAEFFPLLATRLGGERGKRVAEQVVEAAATVAGVPPDAEPREVLASLRKKPGAADALRIRLAEIDAQTHEAEFRERDSARQYQVAIGSAGRLRGNIMLVVVAVGLIACVVVVLGLDPNTPGQLALLTTIAGALLKMLSDAFAFEFGSSAGSKEKDEQIARFQKDLIEVNREQATRVGRTSPTFAPNVSDGGVVAIGDVGDIDGGGDDGPPSAPRERDFVGELRAMAGTI